MKTLICILTLLTITSGSIAGDQISNPDNLWDYPIQTTVDEDDTQVGFDLLEDETRAKSALTHQGLSWPVSGKDTRDISIFFNVEDSIDTIGRYCRTSTFGGTDHFPAHLGIDIRASGNTPVYPIYPGKVVREASGGEWGKAVIISHDNNSWTSVYWHLQDIQVSAGDEVTTSDQLGKVYDTTSLGDVSHVHLGVRDQPYHKSNSVKGYNDCSSTFGFIDPLTILKNNKYQVLDDLNQYRSGNWAESNSIDFYHGVGYHALAPNESGYSLYRTTATWDGTYSVYGRFTPHENRTDRSAYRLYVNGVFQRGRYLTQSNLGYRGQWAYIHYLDLKAGDIVQVKVSNEGSGWLVDDGVLLRRR